MFQRLGIGAYLGRPRGCWRDPWGFLVGPWDVFGAAWGIHGDSLEVLGCSWDLPGTLGRLFRGSWGVLGDSLCDPVGDEVPQTLRTAMFQRFMCFVDLL